MISREWNSSYLFIPFELLKLVCVCDSVKSLWLINWLIHLLALHSRCSASYCTWHNAAYTHPNCLETNGFHSYELVWNWFFFPLCLFYPDGWSYLLSMDGTFLNNEVQICMYPTHLNLWRAAGRLIIPIVCLFALTSLRVSFLMRQTWYSAGLCSMVAAFPLVHLWGMQ